MAPSSTVNESTEQIQQFNKELAFLSDKVHTECAQMESLKQGVENLGREIKELEREMDDDLTKVL